MEHEGVASKGPVAPRIRIGLLAAGAAGLVLSLGACATNAAEDVPAPGADVAAVSVEPARGESNAATLTPGEPSVEVSTVGACRSGLATTVRPRDRREAEIMAGFAPGNPVDLNTARPSPVDIRRNAASATTSGDVDAAEQAATVTMIAYGELIGRSHGLLAANPFVNPQRCVYLVTVNAPFTPDHPLGVEAPTYSRYNVILDEATGMEISLYAGDDLTKVALQ